MRNFRLIELALISESERRARLMRFHPEVTILLGDNDTGKSSVIKSIYHTLGGDIRFDDRWKSANISAVLTFELDGRGFRILRSRNFFALFDTSGKRLWSAQRIHSGLRPKLADLFDFELTLKRKSDSTYETPIPAFQYLPFYIDQDEGWVRAWTSFEGLQQYSAYKEDTLRYHTGIRPNEYYAISKKLGQLEANLAAEESELDVVVNARDEIERDRGPVIFNVDQDLFRREIEKLMDEAQALYAKERVYKRQMSALRSEEIVLLRQREIAESSLRALEKDFRFANEIQEDELECPTCGTEFANSFIARFGIAEDIESARDLLIDVCDRLTTTRRKIQETEESYKKYDERAASVKRLLAEKKGKLSLSDVLTAHSYEHLDGVFTRRIEQLQGQCNRLSSQISSLKAERRKYEDKDRAKEIRDFYRSHMERNLIKLNVNAISEKGYKKLNANVKEMGSDQPRALLAYYYAIIATIDQFGSGVFMPIVIDSPNQQDQDPENLSRMLQFTLTSRPKESQLVLGAVDVDAELPPQCTTVMFEEKLHALREDQYEETRNSLQPLLQQALTGLEE